MPFSLPPRCTAPLAVSMPRLLILNQILALPLTFMQGSLEWTPRRAMPGVSTLTRPTHVGNLVFDLACNIAIAGLPQHTPVVLSANICQFSTEEGEINATHLLLAGDGGISPMQGILGSVAFARFLEQVALQYEIDERELLDWFSTGCEPQGTTVPGPWPLYMYGAEAFELNDALRQRAVALVRRAKLDDAARAHQDRQPFANEPDPPPRQVSPRMSEVEIVFNGQDAGRPSVWL
ncbi:purine nucleoside permease-domain-containing protein [Dichomitus squalens]|nr:purine nucleoside permease-domain-containing protein [Dichomitus squalens]